MSKAPFRERRPEGLRRVPGGVRLRAAESDIMSRPVAGALVRILEARVEHEELAEGLRYARLGQVISLEFADGALEARVQGTAPQPCEARIAIDAYPAVAWRRVIEAMAAEAVYLVKLLDEDLPVGIDELLGGLGLTLLPDAPAVRLECSCEARGACRHVAAAGWLLAEQLAMNPLIVFTLRGMPPGSLLERLREARAVQARGVASAHADPAIPESRVEPAPLEECLDEFWRPGPGLGALRQAPPPHHAPHALLRRLGPSPLKGKFPLVGLLATVYDRVARHAIELRDSAEGMDERADRG